MRPVLVRVSAPHFVAGYEIDVQTGRCVRAAPILKWCVGKFGDELGRYFAQKRYRLDVVR